MSAWLATARELVDQGLAVFALKGKVPPGGHGFKDATTDPKRLAELAAKWPDAGNFGIQPGMCGLVVVDLDEHKSADRVPALIRLHEVAERNGGLPETLTVRTGSGGRHLYFLADKLHPLGQMNGIYNPTSRATESGVDVRGTKGYVVCPPSVHPNTGRSYTWVNVERFDWAHVKPMPAWLHEWLDPPRIKISSNGWVPPAQLPDAADHNQRRVQGLLTAVCDRIGELGEGMSRRTELQRAAYRMAGLLWTGFSKDSMRHQLYSAAHACGKNDRDAFRAIDAALDDGETAPYDLPPDSEGWTQVREQRSKVLQRLRDWASTFRTDSEQDSVEQPDDAPADDEPDPLVIGHLELSGDLEEPGPPKPILPNVVAVLEHDRRWIGRIMLNEFAQRHELDRQDWREGDTGEIRLWLHRVYSCLPSEKVAEEAIKVVLQRHSYHPLRDWLLSLNWDGVPRLAYLLTDGFGVDARKGWSADLPKSELEWLDQHAALVESMGIKWAIGCVARALEPGCKLDTVLVLHGEQGSLKSTGIDVLGGQYYSAMSIDVRSKDARVALQGNWLIEWAELDSMRRSESTAIKDFLSNRVDDFRPPFGRHNQKRPRQCVFVGTTNDHRFLNDSTGDRRFWVVHTEGVDLAWLREHREQLWAEAVSRYISGHPWHLSAAEEAVRNVAAEQYRYYDPWTDAISEWIGLDSVAVRTSFTTEEVLMHALEVRRQDIDPKRSSRVTKVLETLGFEQRRPRKNGGRARRWFRKG